MKIVRNFVLVAAAAGFVSPVLAATRSPSAIVNTVSEADLGDLVRANGDTVDAVHVFDEEPSVRGKTKDGLKYILVGKDCPESAQSGCKSVMMQIRYEADADVTEAKVNDANNAEAAVQTWWDKETGDLGFTRFQYLDGGTTWENLKQNVNLLIDAHYNAIDVVWPPKTDKKK